MHPHRELEFSDGVPIVDSAETLPRRVIENISDEANRTISHQAMDSTDVIAAGSPNSGTIIPPTPTTWMTIWVPGIRVVKGIEDGL